MTMRVRLSWAATTAVIAMAVATPGRAQQDTTKRVRDSLAADSAALVRELTATAARPAGGGPRR